MDHNCCHPLPFKVIYTNIVVGLGLELGIGLGLELGIGLVLGQALYDFKILVYMILNGKGWEQMWSMWVQSSFCSF